MLSYTIKTIIVKIATVEIFNTRKSRFRHRRAKKVGKDKRRPAIIAGMV